MAIRIALAGNPNCGKTTMFNALTGANQYVGNWPGVTVEKKEGKVKSKRAKGEEVIVTDLPGIYSLSPYTLEEVVSRDYILQENPDVIIDLVDATNIERNLYLTTQLVETGVPVVIALNMADLIAKRGHEDRHEAAVHAAGLPDRRDVRTEADRAFRADRRGSQNGKEKRDQPARRDLFQRDGERGGRSKRTPAGLYHRR